MELALSQFPSLRGQQAEGAAVLSLRRLGGWVAGCPLSERGFWDLELSEEGARAFVR